ncbi:MAG: cobalamin biosynthesis protein P47K [Planctomycetes bacterium]|nr:cobalamin biosynthesis protein P47K [Planctomycetota bacterium]
MARARPSDNVRFCLLGGFLGAGKTTALLRLAQRYVAAGRQVGIITNDQADGLVDTETYRAAGFVTEEIPSGCFCCKFDDLIAAAGRLEDGSHPDVLLAEPVGSCTDLVNTVIAPLKRLYANRFRVAPYVALLDPDRAWQALSDRGPGGFSAKVTYIYKMQQNEADVVAINKIDTLTPERLAEVEALVRRNFPKAEIVKVSARTGEGFDQLADLIDREGPAGKHPIEVDYDVYAEGEARLGWVNTEVDLAGAAFDVDQVVLAVVESIRDGLASASGSGATGEPAHVKAFLRSNGGVAVANLVSSDAAVELSRSCGSRSADGLLTVNARVEMPADALGERIVEAIEAVARRYELKLVVRTLEVLSPPRPVPTHTS